MTRRAGRLVLALLVALAAMLVAAGPASAKPQGHIAAIESADGKVTLVFEGNGLTPGSSIDPGSVTVTVGQRRLRATAVPIESGTTKVRRRTAVLVIDTSRSMLQRIGAAQQAAKRFLTLLPDDVRVGVVTFGDKVFEQLRPTTDKTAVAQAVGDLSVDQAKGTALYDGVLQALGTAGAEGTRSVLLVTDGNQVGSKRATLADTVTAVESSGVTLDAVYIGNAPTAPADLTDLVDPVGGDTVKTDPTQLSVIFADAAQAINSQLQVTVTVPADLAESSADVTVTATSSGVRLRDTALATFGAATLAPDRFGPRSVTTDSVGAKVTDAVLPVAIGVLFLGLLVILAVAFTAGQQADQKHGRVRRRLSLYTLTGRAPVQEETRTVLGSSQVARSAVELAGRVVQKRDFEAALDQRLEAGGLPLRAAEWMLVHIGAAIGLALLLLLVSGGSIVWTLIGLVLGLVGPWLYLGFKATRRTSAFLAQLPDTLQLVAGSLSAGYTVPQAMDTVVREGQQPITGEFNRALVEARLGVPVEDALDGVADRMHSKDFAWVVMAIRIQREVGGNLAELLTTVAGTLRERDRLRRQVDVLSAEGRLSAWILGLLPPLFALYLVLVRPAYLRPLVDEALGWLMLGAGVTLLAVGAFWMRKVITVDV